MVWIARTSIEDENCGYRLSVCASREDAREEAKYIENTHDPARGAVVDCYSLRETLVACGQMAMHEQLAGIKLIDRLKNLLPYCTPAMEHHLNGLLTRMCSDMNVGLMLAWVERKD